MSRRAALLSALELSPLPPQHCVRRMQSCRIPLLLTGHWCPTGFLDLLFVQVEPRPLLDHTYNVFKASSATHLPQVLLLTRSVETNGTIHFTRGQDLHT